MNQAEKIILSLGLFLWVVGDLITTYIGWNLGLEEAWLVKGQSIFQLAMLKLGVVGIALITIGYIEKYNKNHLKIPIYGMFLLIGSIAVIGNTIAILEVI